MNIEFVENSHDCGMALKIYAENHVESFELGVIFQNLRNKNLCVWKSVNDKSIYLVVPLICMSEIGLPLYKNPNI